MHEDLVNMQKRVWRHAATSSSCWDQDELLSPEKTVEGEKPPGRLSVFPTTRVKHAQILRASSLYYEPTHKSGILVFQLQIINRTLQLIKLGWNFSSDLQQQ